METKFKPDFSIFQQIVRFLDEFFDGGSGDFQNKSFPETGKGEATQREVVKVGGEAKGGLEEVRLGNSPKRRCTQKVFLPKKIFKLNV